jgi:hypothetical protein
VAERTQEILLRVKAETEGALAQLRLTSSAVDGLGESLEEAVEPTNKLKASIDAVTDQLALFGDRGNEAKAIVEGISDPVLRLRTAQQLSAQAMRGQGSALSSLSDHLKAHKASLVLTLGGQEAFDRTMAQGKLAILGFAGALAGAGVAALKSFLTQNTQTKAAGDRLKTSLDGLVYTLGNALVGGGQRGGKALDVLNGIVKQLAKAIDENRQTIADFAISAANAFLYVAEYGGKAILGLKIIFNVLQDLADNVAYTIGETFHSVTVTLIEAAKSIADLLPENINEALGDPARYWGEALRDAQQDLQAFYAGHGQDSPGFKRVQESADQIEAYTKTFDDLRAKLSGLQGQGFSGTGGRAPRAGGGGGGVGGAIEASSAGLGGLFGAPLSQARDLAVDLAASGERAQVTFGLLGSVLRDVVQPAASEAFGSVSSLYAEAARQTESLMRLTDQLGQSFVAFGIGALQGLTAFALGAQTGGQALGGLLQTLGQLATNTGSFLLLSGLGFQALPLGFTAGGAIAAGAGLIGLGTTLGVAGAAISSGRGAGAAGGASSAGGASFARPDLGARPESQPRRTEIVLQVGREVLGRVIEDEVNARISLNRILNVPATAR